MLIPNNPDPMRVASHADRLAREQAGSLLGLVFAGITAVSLGAMTVKTIYDIFREKKDHRSAGGQQR